MLYGATYFGMADLIADALANYSGVAKMLPFDIYMDFQVSKASTLFPTPGNFTLHN